jgi:3-dehydroquinate synthase
MSGRETIQVALGERSYDIVVGRGLLPEAGALMAPAIARPRVFVITDANVAALHLASLTASLDRAGISHDEIVLPPGEATKEFAQLEALLDRLLEARIERTTTLVALGGGVIGDIVGFAASIALRGVEFVQVPTTLLAQVDSSVGGKTGINTRHGKNLVGTFHQPKLVLADVDALATLPRRELLAGYAEVVKYGLINDPAFFAWLEINGRALAEGDIGARRHAVARSCALKSAVVAADERESGGRALLNLGHTFGHALEAETGFGDELLHGEAVALGMVMAFELSARLGYCPPADAARVRRHLASVGLPTALERGNGRCWEVGRLIEHMSRDKKVRDGHITFVLARGIGKAFIARDVAIEAVHGILDAAIAA